MQIRSSDSFTQKFISVCDNQDIWLYLTGISMIIATYLSWYKLNKTQGVLSLLAKVHA